MSNPIKEKAAETGAKIVEATAMPVAKSVGGTLQDIWDLVFGGFGTFVEKKRLTRHKNLEDFRNQLYDHVGNIPVENIVEPKLSIVGPALEASKYYFEEADIRKMFAKLISSSMDDRVNSKVHASYVEKIKQMSSLDAQNLALFKSSVDYPVVTYQYKVKRSDNSFATRTIHKNIFIANPNEHDLIMQSESITNLATLGLVNITYDSWFADDERYDGFKHTELFHDAKKNLQYIDDAIEVKCKHGIASLTPIGKRFIDVCL